MQKLNDRLKAIALNISPGETVADIGTDHGFLPLFLWEKEISPKIILTDVSEQIPAESQRANAGATAVPEISFFFVPAMVFRHRAGRSGCYSYSRYGGSSIQKNPRKDPDKTKKPSKKLLLQPRKQCGQTALLALPQRF